jgi:SSS family solute:Na+ symporter
MIWVDVLQCILLLAGVLLTIGYVVVVDGSGPLEWWSIARSHTAAHVTPPLFSTDITVRNTVLFTMINMFFWNICTHGSDQVVLQRYFSTSSLRAARRSYFTNVIVDFSMAGLLSMAGLALLAFYMKHAGLLPDGKSAMGMADKLFPFFLGNQLPAGCAGLVMSAFLCDAIQTLESGVNAITAVVTQDLMSKQITAKEAAARQLAVVRKLTVFITLFVTCAAYGVAYLQQRHQLSLVDMMPKFFNMFVGPLAAMFFVGMFLPRATTRSILPAAMLGLALSLVWSWWETILRTETRPTIFLSIAAPCTLTFVTAGLLSLFVDGPNQHSGSGYTWWAIVRGKKLDE